MQSAGCSDVSPNSVWTTETLAHRQTPARHPLRWRSGSWQTPTLASVFLLSDFGQDRGGESRPDIADRRQIVLGGRGSPRPCTISRSNATCAPLRAADSMSAGVDSSVRRDRWSTSILISLGRDRVSTPPYSRLVQQANQNDVIRSIRPQERRVERVNRGDGAHQQTPSCSRNDGMPFSNSLVTPVSVGARAGSRDRDLLDLVDRTTPARRARPVLPTPATATQPDRPVSQTASQKEAAGDEGPPKPRRNPFGGTHFPSSQWPDKMTAFRWAYSIAVGNIKMGQRGDDALVR